METRWWQIQKQNKIQFSKVCAVFACKNNTYVLSFLKTFQSWHRVARSVLKSYSQQVRNRNVKTLRLINWLNALEDWKVIAIFMIPVAKEKNFTLKFNNSSKFPYRYPAKSIIYWSNDYDIAYNRDEK